MDISQRAKEVLGTATDAEMMAVIVLLGANQAMQTGEMATQLLVMRGAFASSDTNKESLVAMRTELQSGCDAMARATESLLVKLDALLEEADSAE